MSSAPGEGTTFTLLLPVVAPSAVSLTAVPLVNTPILRPVLTAPTSELQGHRMLVVDDDVRNVYALTSALEDHGVEVVCASSGQRGLELLETTPGIELVLMDIMMPGMDGYEAIRAIRAQERFEDLPIVALTAKAMRGDREESLAAGASDYVTKPVEIDNLLDTLRVWISR